jgi:hypothetical protein
LKAVCTRGMIMPQRPKSVYTILQIKLSTKTFANLQVKTFVFLTDSDRYLAHSEMTCVNKRTETNSLQSSLPNCQCQNFSHTKNNNK